MPFFTVGISLEKRVLNYLIRTRLCCGRTICIGSSHTPSPLSRQRVAIFLSLSVRRRSSSPTAKRGEEPNHTTARKPGPLLSFNALCSFEPYTSSLGYREEGKGGHNTQVSWTSIKDNVFVFRSQLSFFVRSLMALNTCHSTARHSLGYMYV